MSLRDKTFCLFLDAFSTRSNPFKDTEGVVTVWETVEIRK